jgi:hypothetical protein
VSTKIGTSPSLGTGKIDKHPDSSGVLVIQTGANDAVTIDTAQNVKFSSSGSFNIPAGTTAQRPASPVNGMLRYNTTIPQLEIYISGSWTAIP